MSLKPENSIERAWEINASLSRSLMILDTKQALEGGFDQAAPLHAWLDKKLPLMAHLVGAEPAGGPYEPTIRHYAERSAGVRFWQDVVDEICTHMNADPSAVQRVIEAGLVPSPRVAAMVAFPADEKAKGRYLALLDSAGAAPDPSPLHEAASRCDAAKIEACLDLGVAPWKDLLPEIVLAAAVELRSMKVRGQAPEGASPQALQVMEILANRGGLAPGLTQDDALEIIVRAEKAFEALPSNESRTGYELSDMCQAAIDEVMREKAENRMAV